MKTLTSVLITCAALLAAFPTGRLTAATDPQPFLFYPEDAHLDNPLPTGNSRYGYDVAISGELAVVTGHNRADLFAREEGSWRYTGSLSGPPNTDAILSVVMDGDTLVLGSGHLSSDKGAAYVYRRGADPGRNAWNITSTHSTISYSVNVARPQHGWRYRLDARVLDSYYGGWPLLQPQTLLFRYGDGTKLYGVYLKVNAAGDLVAVLPGASPSEHVLTAKGLGASDYHAHELVFDPGTKDVTYLFNGEPVDTWAGESGSGEGIFWGSDSVHADGSMNVHEARFEIFHPVEESWQVLALYNAGVEGNPAVAPDPLEQGWTLEMGDWPGETAPQSPDPATVWQLQATLTGDGVGADRFGRSLALSGDTLLVGAHRENDGATDTGAAYVFVRNGDGWERQQKLVPSLLIAKDYFGLAVDIDGDTIAVGAPSDYWTVPSVPGRAFVFVRNGTDWIEQAILTASDGAPKDAFGSAVTADGDRVVVGAVNVGYGSTTFAGATYIFERSGGDWTETVRLAADPPEQSGHFGNTLDLRGDRLLVGVHSYSPTYFIFTLDSNGTWGIEHRFTYEGGDHRIGKVAFNETGEVIVGLSSSGWDGGMSGAYIYIPGYHPSPAFVKYVRKLLYYPDASACPDADPDVAAFRYKHLLYADDAGGIRADHDAMATFYGPAERALALDAKAKVLRGLRLFPDAPIYGNLLLDLYYDRSQAETLLARNRMAAAEKARIGPPLGAPAPTGGFIIDNEIEIRRQVLTQSALALQEYFSLLNDSLGVPGDPPLGYRIFRDLVPNRGLMEATYIAGNGDILPVTGNGAAEELYSGFKDLTLLFNLLRDHGRSASTLARLLIARGGTGDIDEANQLLARSERFLFLQGHLLLGMFAELPEEGDPSGLAESIQAWSTSLETLADLRQVIAGQTNILGFAPDFLMLIENFHGPGSDIFDSFDVFKKRLLPSDAASPLKRALDKLQDARASYGDFRGYQDQLSQQFVQSTISYEYRLLEIVGAVPGHPNYSDVPTANPGSELHQQFQSIQLARLRIQRNQIEVDNLAEEIQIEINRAAAVEDVIIRFGNKQAKLTEKIGRIQAAQAAHTAMANSFDLSGGPALMLINLSVGAANAAVVAGTEVLMSNLEADKERLAAEEKAEIEGLNSAARVQTLYLGMRTLEVDSATVALLLQQEVGRMTALYREKAALESRLAEAQAGMATRYFADPVHRLASEANMVEANLRFDRAQRWLFFMARALEYKWNIPFSNHSLDGRTWSTDTLFRLRNAGELEDFHAAMVDFDALINRGKTLRYDWFSVRKDFMGLQDTDDLGNPAEYVDPVTGEVHNAIGMFRVLLGRKTRPVGGGSEIVLDFNTVRQIPGGFFFVGPTFNLDGSISSKGRFLNKIDYLQIRLPGNHTLGRSQLAGNLTYGGTSFIRNFHVGQFDPQRPDRLRNEMTAYSTRYWFYDPTVGQQRWKFTEGYTVDAVAMQLTEDPRVPPTVTKIVEFKERSVAATGWRLTIPLVQQNTQVLRLSELNDIEIYFHHYSAARH